MVIAAGRWTYLCVLVGFAFVGALFLSLGQTTADNYPCNSSGYSAGNFLALCGSKYYGDYEHGALYYGLEPGVRDNIRAAKVIFVGSSTAQAAFSTAAVRAYFHKLNTPHFVLGFGYGDVSPFALAVLKRWQATPKILVINVPFFAEGFLSEPARETVEGRPFFLWRLINKMMFQRVHRALCFAAPSICPESEPAIFRSTRDGQWNWIDTYVTERAIPIDRDAQRTMSLADVKAAAYMGERFLTEVGLNRQCVVLTGTPNNFTDSMSFAAALAVALGTRSIIPSIEGLATLDGAHLNFASAERWSSEFVAAFTPVLEDCIR